MAEKKYFVSIPGLQAAALRVFCNNIGVTGTRFASAPGIEVQVGSDLWMSEVSKLSLTEMVITFGQSALLIGDIIAGIATRVTAETHLSTNLRPVGDEAVLENLDPKLVLQAYLSEGVNEAAMSSIVASLVKTVCERADLVNQGVPAVSDAPEAILTSRSIH